MKIILIADVPKMGKMGEVLEVKDGFGRNYLIPRKLGVEATAAKLQELEQKRTLGIGQQSKAKRAASVLAEKLDGLSLVLPRQVGKEDKLFGSVTSKDLTEELAGQGIEIDRKKILLDDPIKSIGIYEVSIRLHQEVLAKIQVEVIKA